MISPRDTFVKRHGHSQYLTAFGAGFEPCKRPLGRCQSLHKRRSQFFLFGPFSSAQNPFCNRRVSQVETQRSGGAQGSGICKGWFLLPCDLLDRLSPCHLFLVCFEGDFGIFGRGTIQQGRFLAFQIFPKESFDIGFCDGQGACWINRS